MKVKVMDKGRHTVPNTLGISALRAGGRHSLHTGGYTHGGL